MAIQYLDMFKVQLILYLKTYPSNVEPIVENIILYNNNKIKFFATSTVGSLGIYKYINLVYM